MEAPGKTLPISPATQPPLPAPQGHSHQLLPPASPRPLVPVQPSGPHGSHPMPGSRRSSASKAQKGEGAAGSSAFLLCITNKTAAKQQPNSEKHETATPRWCHRAAILYPGPPIQIGTPPLRAHLRPYPSLCLWVHAGIPPSCLPRSLPTGLRGRYLEGDSQYLSGPLSPPLCCS